MALVVHTQCIHVHTHTHTHNTYPIHLLTVAVTNQPCDAESTAMVAGPVVAQHPALRTTEPEGKKQRSPWDQSYATVSDNPHRCSTRQVDKKGRTHSPRSLRCAACGNVDGASAEASQVALNFKADIVFKESRCMLAF